MPRSFVPFASRIAAGFGLAILLATGAPSAAQLSEQRPRPGSRIPDEIPTTELKEDDSRIVQARFADCVVNKHPEQARTFVLRIRYWGDGQPEANRIIKKLADGPCLIAATGGSYSAAMMRFSGGTLGYVLAEALFRVELADPPPLTDLSRIAPLDHPTLDESAFVPARGRPSKSELAKRRATEVGRIYLSEFGECIVRSNPTGAYNLLKTPIASAEEGSSFDKLSDTFQTCRLDEHTVVFSKMVVRGTIAYNYYRLANASGIAPASAVNR